MNTPAAPKTRLHRWAAKIGSLLAAGLILGWVYDWTAPRLYPADVTAGFWRGAAHGALMPAALPSLLAGRNVPIFTERNLGRTYKLGYIAGINLCGLIFFGLAFRPGPSPPPASHVPAQ